ncbi:MAG: HAD family hydrolase [Rikenellaceae bacterium]
MKEQERIVAIIYDFDGTLAAGNMQEYEFIPKLGMEIDEFWKEANVMADNLDADSVLTYMECMIRHAREAGMKLTKEFLTDMGRKITLFNGVMEWFDRINEYGAKKGLKVQHYINSSGVKELVEGTPIADKFHKIYASTFLYDKNGEAYFPAVAVNYTNKTQFIFKINKGIETVSDSVLVNAFSPHEGRPIPFSRMIFVGDGLTDIPSMRLINIMGGHAIAVYDPEKEAEKKEDIMKLIRNKRVNFVAKADYSPESDISRFMENVLDKIAADEVIYEQQHARHIESLENKSEQ